MALFVFRSPFVPGQAFVLCARVATWRNSRNNNTSVRCNEQEQEEMIRVVWVLLSSSNRARSSCSLSLRGLSTPPPDENDDDDAVRGHEGSSDKGFFCFIFQVIIECRSFFYVSGFIR